MFELLKTFFVLSTTLFVVLFTFFCVAVIVAEIWYIARQKGITSLYPPVICSDASWYWWKAMFRLRGMNVRTDGLGVFLAVAVYGVICIISMNALAGPYWVSGILALLPWVMANTVSGRVVSRG